MVMPGGRGSGVGIDTADECVRRSMSSSSSAIRKRPNAFAYLA
jgi:hypothetical protein